MTSDYTTLMADAAEAAGLQPSAIVQPEDRYVRLNGLNFHYLDWGNAHLPHVVLLHGGSLTAHTWDMAALLLRDRYHLVALDQRGHGDTEWTPEADRERGNEQLMSEDTEQFIDHLGYDRIALVGMSMGGMNSVRYAARHQQRLDALCIVDIAPEVMQAGVLEMEQFRTETETMDRFEDFLERAVKFMPHRPQAHLRYSLTHSLRQTEEGKWTWKQDHRMERPPSDQDEAALKAERDRRAEQMWIDLRAIQTPTLLMRGESSKILSPEAAEHAVAAMSHARLVVIPRATHNVHSDNPGDFARELDAFLSEVLPAARA